MAFQLALANQKALYFSVRRKAGTWPITSVVKLRHRGHGTVSRKHLFKGSHGDHQGDIGLSVAGHVRAAVGEGSRVDGEFEGSTGIASTNITYQDVVVLGFFFCGL